MVRLLVHAASETFLLETTTSEPVGAVLGEITRLANWIGFLRALAAFLETSSVPQHHREMLDTVLRRCFAMVDKEPLAHTNTSLAASDVDRALFLAFGETAADLKARLAPATTYTTLVCCKKELDPAQTLGAYYGPNEKSTITVYVH